MHERGFDAGITRFATVAKYNVRIRRPRLFGAAVLGNAQPSQMRLLTPPFSAGHSPSEAASVPSIDLRPFRHTAYASGNRFVQQLRSV